MRNLSLKQGLCNGSRLEVVRLHQNCVLAKLISGSNAGEEVLIPKVKLTANLPFTLERTQFPLRLAYSMTINKAQGQTFESLGIYLPQPVFSHGQLYVAFSRARALSDVFVKVTNTDHQGKWGDKFLTRNIVYRELESRNTDAKPAGLVDTPPPVLRHIKPNQPWYLNKPPIILHVSLQQLINWTLLVTFPSQMVHHNFLFWRW